MLQVQALSCERADRSLFTDLTFQVVPGQLLQIVGSNGSGKSTLLRCLVGLYSAYQGEILWTLEAPPLYAGHRPGVKDHLTVSENIRWTCALRGATPTPVALEQALDTLALSGYGSIYCGNLSEGQRKRVGLAQFLLLDNPCWIMDEPFSAIDGTGLGLLRQKLEAHLDTGGAVILSSHQAVEIDHPITSLALS